MPSRNETLLAPIDRSMRILEIGPSYSPVAPKAEGWKTKTVDHATRSELVEKYRLDPSVDVSRIEEVDFVWSRGKLSEAVPSNFRGSFDALIASHVIEHSPDLLAFLESAADLLAPSGVVALAVPDKRYCFDYFEPLTTTGQVLAAHAEGRTRHTRGTAFDQAAYMVSADGSTAWTQAPINHLSFIHSIEYARELFATTREDEDAPYGDYHTWRFTPSNFELILLELARLGATNWLVERTTPASGCEFLAWLRRDTAGAIASLPMAALTDRRLDLLKRTLLETKEQIDFLLVGEAEFGAPTRVDQEIKEPHEEGLSSPGATGRRDLSKSAPLRDLELEQARTEARLQAAEAARLRTALEAIQQSRCWRLTLPLRLMHGAMWRVIDSLGGRV